MKRLRIITLALLALFALGAVVAATASAEEGLLPLKLRGLQILGTKPKLLTTNKEPINCESVTGAGTFTGTEKNDIKGTGNLDFNECETLGFAAFSLGDKETSVIKEAKILVPVSFEICLINSAKLEFGIFVTLTSPVHIEAKAAGALIEVTGSVIGTITTVGPSRLFGVTFAQTNGVQAVTECKNEAGVVKKASLKSKLCPNETLSAGQSVEKGLLQFEEEVTLMDK